MQELNSDLQQFQLIDKYLRWNWDKGRRETFDEAVDRSIAHAHFMVGDTLTPDEYEELRQGMITMDAFPSLRFFQTAGPEATRHPQSLFNCSYLPVIDTQSFAETLFLLGLGVGVGYSVENRNVKLLPAIPSYDLWTGHREIVIEDSLEGWAHSLKQALDFWFAGIQVSFNFSKLRPAGAPLKTRGGYSSGPEPFAESLSNIERIVAGAAGRSLRPIEAHDIQCFIASAIVSGGFRRSAMISLFDVNDIEMFDSKARDWYVDEPQRRYANNSFVLTKEYSENWWNNKVDDIFKGGYGEPGIFSRFAAENMKPTGRRTADWGTNPSLRAGTRVMTKSGIFPIEQLEGKQIQVRNLNGEWSDADCFLSGKNKQLIKITLSGGIEYFCTPEHKWPVLKNDKFVKTLTTSLVPGDILPINESEMEYGSLGTADDGFWWGWIYGDGNIHQRKDTGIQQVALVVSEKDAANGILERLNKILPNYGNGQFSNNRDKMWEIAIGNRTMSEALKKFGVVDKQSGLPTALWENPSKEFVFNFLDGLISSDGHISKKGRISIVSKHEKFADDLIDLLGFVGIRANKSVRRYEPKKIVDKVYGDGTVFISYAVRFSGKTFRNRGGKLTHRAKNLVLESLSQNELPKNIRKVISVETTDLFEDVWDITVYDQTHCFALSSAITGNCGEVVLRPFQFCNLSIANIRADDDYEDIQRKTRLATIWGTIQATATYFPGNRREWSINQIEERLLGVDLNGQRDSMLFRDAKTAAKFDWGGIRGIVQKTNQEYAAKFGIRQGAALMSAKPAGNSSVLFDTASGIHPRFASYYIRRVQVLSVSPLAAFLASRGVPFSELVQDSKNTLVFEFPVMSPNPNGIFKGQETAIEQLEYWKLIKTEYTDHNPSVTIDYRDNELEAIAGWLYNNQKIIGGLSFFPFSDVKYDNAPYEEISEDDFSHRSTSFEIDWDNYSSYDSSYFNPTKEFACVGGACDLQL